MTYWAMKVGHGPWHDGPRIKSCTVVYLIVCLLSIMDYHHSSSKRRGAWTQLYFGGMYSLIYFFVNNWNIEYLMVKFSSTMASSQICDP